MVFSVVLAAILRDAAKTPLLRMTSEIASRPLRMRPQWQSLNHHLPHHPPAIHLVCQLHHRGAGKVPGQAGTQRAGANQFVGEPMMEVADRIGLPRGGLLPAESEGFE